MNSNYHHVISAMPTLQRIDLHRLQQPHSQNYQGVQLNELGGNSTSLVLGPHAELKLLQSSYASQQQHSNALPHQNNNPIMPAEFRITNSRFTSNGGQINSNSGKATVTQQQFLLQQITHQ